MGRYILRRFLWMVPVVLGVTILVFTIMYLIPGDPVKMMLGAEATADEIAAMRQRLGLNDPYLVRLGRFVGVSSCISISASPGSTIPPSPRNCCTVCRARSPSRRSA